VLVKSSRVGAGFLSVKLVRLSFSSSTPVLDSSSSIDISVIFMLVLDAPFLLISVCRATSFVRTESKSVFFFLSPRVCGIVDFRVPTLVVLVSRYALRFSHELRS